MSVSLETLNDRDLEVATLLATGHTRATVARKLNCSEPTIQGVIARLRHATGGENVTHMVAILVDEGVVQFSDRNRVLPALPENAGPAAHAVHETLMKRGAQMRWSEYRAARQMYDGLVARGL